MEGSPAHKDRRKKPLLLSVVVPAFNEEQVICLTHDRIVEVLGTLEGFDLEVVYVDDGSKDRTSALLFEIAHSDRRVCVASLTRNFGHQSAVTAGLRQASGDVVAVIDADLQDPVELIPEMLAKWREGYSVVYGIRRNRQESLQKVFAYNLFYRLLTWLSDIDFPRDSGDFCLLDRTAVNAINRLPEKNRFIRGLRAWYGGRQIGLTYDRPPRAAGRPGYTVGRLFNLAFDGIVSFSLLPLRLIFWLGFGSFIFAMSGLLFFLAHRIFAFKIFGHSPSDVPGFTSLILGFSSWVGFNSFPSACWEISRAHLSRGQESPRVPCSRGLFAVDMHSLPSTSLQTESTTDACTSYRSRFGGCAPVYGFSYAKCRAWQGYERRLVHRTKALGTSVLLVLVRYSVRAWRWRLMLRGDGVAATYLHAAPTFAAFALNNVLPVRAGDVYRCVSAARLPRGMVAKSVAALWTERVLDLAALIGLLGVLLFVFPNSILSSLWSPLGGALAVGLTLLAVLVASPAATWQLIEWIIAPSHRSRHDCSANRQVGPPRD